jgi:hypothetical protein
MNFTDFLEAVRLILLRRLKVEEWAAAKTMSFHSAAFEKCFHEGYAPLEAISAITGVDLPEYFGDPNFDPTTLKDAPLLVQQERKLLPNTEELK